MKIEKINEILKLNPGSDTPLYFPDDQNMETIMRKFDTGATRDSDNNKLDYEGFYSPYVLRRYAEYMHKHRVQADGELRDSDNWQRGIPLSAYMKSFWRHFMELWTFHRHPAQELADRAIEDTLCAIIFNAMGYLHEIMKPTKL